MPFLSTNQPCRSTEKNLECWPQLEKFIHRYWRCQLYGAPGHVPLLDLHQFIFFQFTLKLHKSDSDRVQLSVQTFYNLWQLVSCPLSLRHRTKFWQRHCTTSWPRLLGNERNGILRNASFLRDIFSLMHIVHVCCSWHLSYSVPSLVREKPDSDSLGGSFRHVVMRRKRPRLHDRPS